MKRIPHMTEVTEALRTLNEFVGAMKDIARMVMPDEYKPSNMPKTWKKRIINILQDAGKPLTPIELYHQYCQRRWDSSHGKKQTKSYIRATLSFMKRDGQVVHNDRDKTYSLPFGVGE